MIYADANVRYRQSEWESWISVSLCSRERKQVAGYPTGVASHRVSHSWPLVEYPWPRSRRCATWGLKDITAGYDQRKKLSVRIAICLCLPRSACLSYTPEVWTLSRIKCVSYIFTTKSHGRSGSIHIYSFLIST